MAYPVGLVGESHYQAAIARCELGQEVLVCHEIGNPYDEFALRVETIDGAILGYIARDHWLRAAVFEEEHGVAAAIGRLDRAEGGDIGVVIWVETDWEDIELRDYKPPN